MCLENNIKLFNYLKLFSIFLILNDFSNASNVDQLILPKTFTALSGDLVIEIQLSNLNKSHNNASSSSYNILINKLDLNQELIDNITLNLIPKNNSIKVSTKCKNIFKGGLYEIELFNYNLNNSKEFNDNTLVLSEKIDIKWPVPKLYVNHKKIGTYPDSPVEVLILFQGIKCDINIIDSVNVPEFLLELFFCGQDFECNNMSLTASSVVYAEQIHGITINQTIQLGCELFGLAGQYLIKLRPIKPTPSFVTAIDFITADWNEQFVFNVHARSIFPCDSHTGIGVLFEYPKCIIDQSDRIRLFSKLRADVSSLKPPTTMHYITEHKIKKGQHSFHFDCDNFSEKYIEYCFVYVSQAISGAVADIRMDCVPTLSVIDSDTGGWGPWSAWTPCSTTCLSGTRNRYRFCDSPAPRYGAKFCEGSAVETENCDSKDFNSLECIYGIKSTISSKNLTDGLAAEIGPGCRCGCIVHLGSLKPTRLLAASAQSCPGRSFWLIQADPGELVSLQIEFVRLPCIQQYIKVRDGDSMSSDLILQLIGEHNQKNDLIISSNSQMLLEFVSNEFEINEKCKGGFLAKVQQTSPNNSNDLSNLSRPVLQKPLYVKRLTIINITAVFFASIIIFTSALLGAQYIHRYKKYHLTNNKMGQDSPLSTPRTSLGSLQNLPTRAISTSTLLSEVIYLVKIRPKNHTKHSILRESIASDKISLTADNTLINCINCKQTDKKLFKNEILNDGKNISSDNDEFSNYSLMNLQSKGKSISCENLTFKLKKNENDLKATTDILKRKIFGQNIELNHENISACEEKLSNLSSSNATLTNGCYSPAASIVSTATIRTTNEKEKKEKKNRAKLLSRPTSEFSLSNQGELELDYYDYNVINAGAAPGSYLGMDPAYLVWIPPINEGNILEEFDDENNSQMRNMKSHECNELLPNCDEEIKPKNMNYSLRENDSKSELIQLSNSTSLTDCTVNENRYKSMRSKLITSHLEKETVVVKSPSDFQDYYEMDDIKFVDDEELETMS